MNYVAQSRSPNPAAAIGALGVPAGIGAILILGLAVTVVVDPPTPNPTATPEPTTIPLPPPPPDPTVPPDTKPPRTTADPTIIPLPPTPDIFDGPLAPIGDLPDPNDDILGNIGPSDPIAGTGTGGGTAAPPKPKPTPPPLPDPIAASPRGNPGAWITTRDYRPRWVRSGMEGSARFNLEISASGRVTNCTVTGSTGHNALDVATCRLIKKRAKFTPARNSAGDKVSGSYSNSVTWRLPE